MADEESTEEAQPKKKKGNLLIIIIIVFLFVLLLVIVGAIAFLMFSTADESKKEEAKVKEEEAKKVEEAKKKENKESKRSTDYAHIGVMFPLEPFTINLLSESGGRYVKCNIELEQNVPTLTPELTSKVAMLRDIIISTLSTKTFEEISTNKGKERLKDELVGKINEILSDGFIKNLYFTNFIVS